MVRYEFNELASSETPREEAVITDFDAIIGGLLKNPTAPLDNIHHYTERLGATLGSSPQGHAFVNGKHFDMDDVGC